MATVGSQLSYAGHADPSNHRDSWPRATTFLAHEHLAPRIALIDLNGLGPNPRVSSWNPLGMDRG
ncbi:hypothetical protein ACWDG9_45365, partial [Streptomyces sp. NPDC001073]